MSGERDEPEVGPEVGSVADEAAKLFGALADWAKDTTHLPGGLSGLGGFEEHLATGAPECTYCPVCRTVHAVRQLSPEVRAQLATAGTALLQAASTLLASATSEPRPTAGFEHIDLDDGAADWPDEAEDGEDLPGPEEGDDR